MFLSLARALGILTRFRILDRYYSLFLAPRTWPVLPFREIQSWIFTYVGLLKEYIMKWGYFERRYNTLKCYHMNSHSFLFCFLFVLVEIWPNVPCYSAFFSSKYIQVKVNMYINVSCCTVLLWLELTVRYLLQHNNNRFIHLVSFFMFYERNKATRCFPPNSSATPQ